jgi:HK97 family phage prohead protease
MIERRFNSKQIELRVAAAPSGRNAGRLVGYAAIYSKPGDVYGLSDDMGGWRERCSAGMVRNLDGDIRSCLNHDPSKLLARTTSGTLRLSTDRIGLRADIEVSDTSYGRDLVESVKRGDLTGMSFAFTTNDEDWNDETLDGERVKVRTLKSIQLHELGPVTFPAYNSSHIGAVDQERLILPSQMGRSLLFPEGVPMEVRSHVGHVGEPRVILPRRRNLIDLLMSL